MAEVLELEVDDADVAGGLVGVVGLEGGGAGDRVVTRKHGLLGGLGLATRNRERLWRGVLSRRAAPTIKSTCGRSGSRVVEGGRCQVALLLVLGVIVVVALALWLESLDTLFEFVIGASSLSLDRVLVAHVVHIDSFLVDRSMGHVICLVQNGRSELLLPLSERIYIGGAYIDRFGHACGRLPVGSGAHFVSLGVPIVIRRLAVDVAAAKNARLQLGVLLITRIRSTVLVAPLLR